MSELSTLKVAVIHDWITVNGGAEVVLNHILSLVPQADIYTMVDTLDEKDKGWLKGHSIFTSPLQKFSFIAQRYKNFIPLMPFFIEQFDLTKYDLIISSSHAVAKGVITHPHQKHISYIYTPLRYAWDMTYSYDRIGVFKKGIIRFFAQRWLHRMRIWDVISATRPDELIAVSHFISKRIQKSWGRDSTVIYPPVELEMTQYSEIKKEYYITLSRLVEYKRIDIIVEAFRACPNKELIVIGEGSQRKTLEKMAPKNVHFKGYLKRDDVMTYLSEAKAFIFMSKEDFGIVPVESQACGTPVIAYREGGASETIIENLTGVFFDHQTPEALCQAIEKFEQLSFDPKECLKNSQNFSVEHFKTAFKKRIQP